MKVVIVNYGYDSDLSSPEMLVERYYLLAGLAESIAAAGGEVVVVQGFAHDARLERRGVRYELVGGPFSPQPARWHVPVRLHRLVRAASPQVVHLNGLLFPLQTLHLRRVVGPACPLVLQHHAERPSGGVAAWIQRWGLGAADAFVFTAAEQAEDWRRRGMIRERQRVYEITECSTRFRPAPRESCRRRTGVRGRPVFLWAGNLDGNKDPLTVLDGFERALGSLPEARLYMAFRGDGLLAEVKRRLAASGGLGAAVELLGRVEHAAMEDLFNSADYFVQGSHYEGGAGAVVEALACGVVPVVTDIPALRAITGGGSVGELWAAGDAAALSAAIARVVAKPLDTERRAARDYFEHRFSFETVGRLAVECYRELSKDRPA